MTEELSHPCAGTAKISLRGLEMGGKFREKINFIYFEYCESEMFENLP